MSKKAGDILARMKQVAVRERIAEAQAQPEAPGGKRVRVTVDLDPSQHRFLKIFAAERGLKGSEVLRALLAELHSDTELQQAIQERLGR
ncbi:MAG: hypothetical protein C4333_11610 [Meiothermus sp.]